MKVYLVGGAVRDQLLGLPVHDKDFVVVGSNFDEMKSLGFVQVGADFPVFLHPDSHFEYALARIERKNGTGYQGFATDTKGVSLADDLFRRDLTINALAIEVNGLFDDRPTTGQVIDFYGGIADLNNKTLRHISFAFCEDPLRILRTVRFLARYRDRAFIIADETLALMQSMAQSGELNHLSRERFWAESVKAMASGTGHDYWQCLKTLGILPYFLKPLDECWQNERIFNKVIDALALAKHSSIAVQFAVLCSGHLGDDDLSTQLIKEVANQLNAPKYCVQIANLLSEFYDDFYDKPTASKLIRFIEQTKSHQGNFQSLNDVLTAIFIVNPKPIIGQSIARQILLESIALYKKIGIKDIDKQLKGKQIGLALNELRRQKIQQLLDECYGE